MTRKRIDNRDLEILKILQENCKITNLELSNRIGLSPAPTLERVKKLEASGVIESYHATVNPKAIGLNVQTFILIDLAWDKPQAREIFIKAINGIPEIVGCHLITGEADVLIRIICADIAEYERILYKTLSQIDVIDRMKTLITLSTLKESYVLPYDYGR